MKGLRRFLLRVRGSIARRPGEARLREEIEAHLALQTAENLKAGMLPEEARRQAVLKFGAIEALKEEHRDRRGLPFVEQLVRDIRYALRGLRKNPGFSAVAVLTLAFGIGANTAMFAVVNGVLLKPLPFEAPDRLMLVHLRSPGEGLEAGTYRETVWSYPKYRTFLEIQEPFEDTALFAGRDLSLSGDDNPESVRGETVTDRYPGILGITPILGRAFTGEEAHRPGEALVALIGHTLWTRRYGADPAIIGRRILINRLPYTVVGVLPPGFRGLTGNAEVWVPFAALDARFMSQRQAHGYYLVARRRAEVSEAHAMAAVQVAGSQIAVEYGNKNWGASAASLYSSRIDRDLRRAAFVLLGAVGLVLLIACVNLANLLIARALGRRREVAVRAAIGASRGQIARQFLAEGFVLAGLGAGVGIMVAALLLDAAATLLPDADVFLRTPIAQGAQRTAAAGLTRVGASMIDLDSLTLLFTAIIAVVASMLIALVPAMRSGSLMSADALKASGCDATPKARWGFSARGVLVIIQTAVTLVLLAGTGLMIKSAARLQAVAIGVNPDRVYTASIGLPADIGISVGAEVSPGAYTPERSALFFEQLIDRLRALPGVDSVGAANCAALSGDCSDTLVGFDLPRRMVPGMPGIGVHWATPEYFSTVGIQLRTGRLFTSQDRAGRPKVVVVNESAVRAYWPNVDPIGKTVTLGMGGFESGAEVVGVVSDVRHSAIESAPVPDVYIPFLQAPIRRMRLFVRSGLDQAELVRAIRREVARLDGSLPVTELKTLEERIGDAMWRTRVTSSLLSAFSGLALLLTAIGIFGVLQQTVSQRTPEIGVRMAFGAETRDVLGLVLRRAMILTGAGILLGIPLAIVLTRLMGILLYEVQPGDTATLAAVSFILATVALVASYVPARRAARVDPLVALRSE